MHRKVKLLLASVALALGGFSGASALAEDFKVAFFASSAQNGFNQAVYEGVVAKAKEMGVETSIYDGQFDAALQYSQIEDVLAGNQFDGFVVVPNDTVGIAGAVEQVGAAGKPLVTALFPIGPDLARLEPQVPGVTATVASPPAEGAKVQAEDVVKFCEGKDPCNVVIIIGQKIYPFDNLRQEAYLSVLGAHPNIKVVASGEGNYDPDKSLTVMQDILQANKDIDVVLSNADQHLVGVEIALRNAGYDVSGLYLSGGGASSIAVEAIREGRWDATLAYFPVTMGKLALEAVVKKLKGEDVSVAVDMDKVGPLPALVTKAVLDQHPDFKGEWAQ
ncbi:ribose ABC transporter substrate-binding protein [Mesorhizobium sp. L-8-10]|uniref:sugar ABC transporter substrate-binding protein n=1 Tax=Mesorhizobium sp. L-8-10 TaxID=2744523 RepID=UPI00192717BF|nr:sugar ABC transporter substrate-binding protein [Mesorhizobium sp. L-8-10]BCH35484.1 ribose ABC transporter substrate-binding protein [Mesorhizobium sp. L-8-10]